MPQTREHLDILSMLKIKRGVIALTKADLVEDEWLEMVSLEIEEETQGSFLEGAEIIPVSAVTGAGVDKLRAHIYDLLERSVVKNIGSSFRVPIDRVFTMEGFGTVATGTLLEGGLSESDEITVFPSLKTTRPRFIQVFGEQATHAKPGQRVAINLAQIKVDEVARGDVLATPGSMENTYLLDVRLDILPDAKREILNNTRVHLYHGTRDLLCRISLIGCEKLAQGEIGYAQLHLAEPLAAKCGDPFVIRFYSPLETIGGGVILDPCPVKKLRNNQESYSKLVIKDTGSPSEKFAVFVGERLFPEVDYIARISGLRSDALEKDLFIVGKRVIHRDNIARYGKRAQEILLMYHEKNPLHKGMPVSELSSQIFNDNEQAHAADIINLCCKLDFFKKAESGVAHKNFSVKVNERQQKMRDEVLLAFKKGGFTPPGIDELEETYAREKKVLKQILDDMISHAEIILLTPQICIHSDFYEKARTIFIDEVTKNGEITLAQFRDKLETSRKYAMVLLEYFDKKKISRKVGDSRVLGQ